MSKIISLAKDYYANPAKYFDPNATSYIYNGEFRTRMQKLCDVLGVSYLGEGHFSKVYPINSKWVMKLDCNNGDEAYAAYADYCMTTTNPFAPRIRAKIKLNGCTIYVLEKLTEVRYHPRRDELNSLIDQIYDAKRGAIVHPYPELQELIRGFGARNFNDVADRNCMMRGDQLVITDPCSSFHGLGYGSDQLKDAPQMFGPPKPAGWGWCDTITARDLGKAFVDENPCVELVGFGGEFVGRPQAGRFANLMHDEMIAMARRGAEVIVPVRREFGVAEHARQVQALARMDREVARRNALENFGGVEVFLRDVATLRKPSKPPKFRPHNHLIQKANNELIRRRPK